MKEEIRIQEKAKIKRMFYLIMELVVLNTVLEILGMNLKCYDIN